MNKTEENTVAVHCTKQAILKLQQAILNYVQIQSCPVQQTTF